MQVNWCCTLPDASCANTSPRFIKKSPGFAALSLAATP